MGGEETDGGDPTTLRLPTYVTPQCPTPWKVKSPTRTGSGLGRGRRTTVGSDADRTLRFRYKRGETRSQDRPLSVGVGVTETQVSLSRDWSSLRPAPSSEQPDYKTGTTSPFDLKPGSVSGPPVASLPYSHPPTLMSSGPRRYRTRVGRDPGHTIRLRRT